MLVTTLIIGWFILLPDEYMLLGKHIFGGAVYINNFMLFLENGDYFNAESNAKPLLHLWSLGVEEQFYFIFPFILYIIYRLNINFLLTLLLFSVISFYFNLHSIYYNYQSRAFYLPWCRFWELSSGSILAYILNYHQTRLKQINKLIEKFRITEVLSKIIYREPTKELQSSLIANIIALLGICFIIFGVFFLKNNAEFPGVNALIPVAGSLLVIAAGSNSFINNYILSNRVFVFLGLISYPLYLWHWPLLSLAYICEGQIPVIWIRVTAIFISVLCAIGTFYYIEPPLRYGAYSKAKALCLFFTLLSVGAVGYNIYNVKGYENRFKHEISSELSSIISNTNKYHQEKNFYVFDQFIDNCKKVFPYWAAPTHSTQCAFQNLPGKNNIAIIGSSHAAHLFYGISLLAKKDNNAVALFPMSSQSPFMNLQTLIEGRQDWYKRIMDAYQYIKKEPNIKVVVLSEIAGNYRDVDNPNVTSYEELFSNAVKRTFDQLSSKKIIVVLDNPWLPFDPKICVSSRPLTLTKSECNFSRITRYVKQQDIDNKIILEVARQYQNVRVVDIEHLFCKRGMCSPIVNGKLMYRDIHHFNYDGSKYVAPYIYKEIIELLKQQ